MTQHQNTELPDGTATMINLRYSLYGAPNKHPQDDMRDLGIAYTYGIPQSIADQWWFLDCQNVPDALPEYITLMEADRDYNELVGNGLDKEMAAVLNLKLLESRPAKAVGEDIDTQQFAIILSHLEKGNMAAPWMLEALNGYFKIICDRTEAALKPESGGIAGKGDALNWFEEMLEYCEQDGSEWLQSDLDIIQTIKNTLSTLTRPQEVDLEALKRIGTQYALSVCENDGIYRIEKLFHQLIDHLHTSGYLSALNLTQESPNVSETGEGLHKDD